MFRRHFMQRIALAGASTAAVGVAAAGDRQKIKYRVKGFTCVTCAVGLETLLRQEKGILRAEASYPDATLAVEFDPGMISDERIKDLVSQMGFAVQAAS